MYAFGKCDKCILHFLYGSVYIKMVRIHGRNNCYIRREFQKASVVFICFNHINLIIAAPEIGLIICGDAAQKGIATITTVTKQVCYHGGYGCFAMCSPYAYIVRTFSYPLQHIAALNNCIIIFLVIQ